MTSLKSLTLDQILSTYDLPHRLLVYFASQCAKDTMSRVKDPDLRSMLAVDVAERFGNGEDFSQKYLEKVRDAASSSATASYAATAAASYAAHAAASSFAASYAAHAAAAHAAASAASYANAASYKDLLIKLIETRLTPLEKLLIFS